MVSTSCCVSLVQHKKTEEHYSAQPAEASKGARRASHHAPLMAKRLYAKAPQERAGLATAAARTILSCPRCGDRKEAPVALAISPDLQMLENSALGQSMKFCPFSTRSHAFNNCPLCVQYSLIYCSLGCCEAAACGVRECDICGIAVEVSSLGGQTPRETRRLMGKDGTKILFVVLP